MPVTNYTIDDGEPIIQYAPADAWGDMIDADPSTTQYSNNGTFTVCNTKDCSATFTFNGTHVWIYGSKRKDHAYYSVALDGQTTEYDGFSDDDSYTSLYDSGALDPWPHTVIITNIMNDTDRPYLDIDYITWSTDDSAVPPNITLEDDASQFSYQPSDAWNADFPSEISGFQGDSGHFTEEKSAAAVLSFSGDTVALFGAIGPNSAPYDIKIDGQPMGTFSAARLNYGAQRQLYHADALGAGNHTLEVIHQPTSAGQRLAIDFALVAGFPSATLSSSTSSSSPASATATGTTANSKDSKMPVHTFKVIGFVVAGVAAACLLATLVGFVIRQTGKRKRKEVVVERSMDVSAFTDGDRNSLNASYPEKPHSELETTHLLDMRTTLLSS
ncbi:hypothetical protein C8R43DRAFT_1186132 [Mycena crocata]|nr:hypothetical protein C8R43DRAFT_1186132 [Mycena crocata]